VTLQKFQTGLTPANNKHQRLLAIGNVGGQNAALQTTSLGIRTRARNHQGVAPKYKVHRRTVRAALQNALPPKRKVTPRERPKMALAIPFIDAVLENNLKATFSNQLTAHQIWVRMQVEMPGCDIGESTVRAYVRVRKAEVDGQQTSSQAAAAWMMGVLHRNVPLRFIEKEFPSSAASSLAGIIKRGRWRERKKALAVLGCLRGIRTVVIARAVPFTRLLAG